MLKHFISSLAAIWLCLTISVGVLGLTEVPNQIGKDTRFFQTVINPPVKFVKYFRKIHHRLPSDDEFNNWLISTNKTRINGLVDYIHNQNHIVSNDKARFAKADWRKDFAIGAWRGEWMEYYFSWTDTYDVNSYSWKDGWIDFAFCACLGILPLVILYFFRKTRGIN